MICISGQPGTYGTFGLEDSNPLPEYPPYVGLKKRAVSGRTLFVKRRCCLMISLIPIHTTAMILKFAHGRFIIAHIWTNLKIDVFVSRSASNVAYILEK